MGGERRLVLGEAAGVVEPQARALSVGELIGGLPRDLVCDAPVWSQHGYVGGRDPVAAATTALAARGCPREHAIWITETGVGTAPSGLSFARGVGSEREGCRLLHERLSAWYDDPRVTVAMQYTMREDHLFPTGLVTTDLSRARAALGEWQAWGARPALMHRRRTSTALGRGARNGKFVQVASSPGGEMHVLPLSGEQRASRRGGA